MWKYCSKHGKEFLVREQDWGGFSFGCLLECKQITECQAFKDWRNAYEKKGLLDKFRGAK